MREMPSGTVTFLFTDIEGSTRRWEHEPDAMRASLRVHDELLRGAIESHAGHVVKGTGDGVFAVFERAEDGVAAAAAAQHALGDAQWPDGVGLRVRMGLHLGAVTVHDGDYFGPDINRAARLMAVAHGGQIVCSRSVGELVGDHFRLIDLGEHRLRDLESSLHVFQVDAPGLVSTFPPLRSLDGLPGNLPRQITTFVGREAEIAAVAELVGQASLVTLTGVGGVGKTRLALQVAAEAVKRFPDGAWVCEYAPVADPGAVWEALAASLRVQAYPGRSLQESVLDYLSAKQVLLVLDNCEHLLAAVAAQVDAVEQQCQEVSILATSREGLGLGGERMVAVPSLGVPADDATVDELVVADAVRLFCDRATDAKVDFVLDAHNAGAVGVLCRRLDGIPLAIELAAARVRSMSPADLVARLDQRFKLLTKGSRAALERQQTLRATIDWSYGLLNDVEWHVLDRLSVFAGGCDLDAAEAILAGDDLDGIDVVDALSQLVDKSLVVAEDSDRGVRYRLLETIRQYAQERLEEHGGSAELRRRHAEYYVAMVETAGPHLWGRDQVRWIDEIMADVDNLRAVLDWSIETTSPDHALRLLAPLDLDNELGDVAGGWGRLAAAISGAQENARFPQVAACASWSAVRAGDFENAERLLADAERVAVELNAPRWAILQHRTVLAFGMGDFEQSLARAEEWADLARTSGDLQQLSRAFPPLVASLAHAGRIEEATALAEEAIRVARHTGHASGLAFALAISADLLPLSESARASAQLDESLELATETRNNLAIAAVWSTRGWLAARRDDFASAFEAALVAADLFNKMGDIVLILGEFALGGIALRGLGDLEGAAVLFGMFSMTRDRPTGVPPGGLDILATTIDKTVIELGAERYETHATRGASFEIAEATAYLRARAEPLLPHSPPV